MFSVAQIRAVQANLALAAGRAVAESIGLYEAIQSELHRPGDELGLLCLLPVAARDGAPTHGLALRYRSDAEFAAQLILPRNTEPAQALHVGFEESVNRPTLVGLHYVHMQKRTVHAAWYLLFGALTVHDDPDHEYVRLRKKEDSMEQLARLLHVLNTRVEDLPYPAGRKLSILDVLKQAGLRYVGELVQKNPGELRRALNDGDWLTLKVILLGLHVTPGTQIPQWRAPKGR